MKQIVNNDANKDSPIYTIVPKNGNTYFLYPNNLYIKEGPEGGLPNPFPSSFFSKSHFAILKFHFHFWFLTFFSHYQWPKRSPVAWNPFSRGKTCQSQFPFYPFRTLIKLTVFIITLTIRSRLYKLYKNYVWNSHIIQVV